MRIFPILLVSASLAMNASADDGWQKARWGMTKEEVAKLYPEAKPGKDDDLHLVAGENLPVGLQLSDYLLVERYFTIKFLFDQEARLICVRLAEAKQHPRDGDKIFLRLRRLLTGRYGKPVGEEILAPSSTSLVWHDGDREIMLKQTFPPRSLDSWMTIEYVDRSKTTRAREAKKAETAVENSILEKL